MSVAIFVAVSVVILAVLIIGVVHFISKNYIKVPPNQVAVFYGRKYKVGDKVVGFKVITGGARFRIPIIEKVAYLDLNVFSIMIEVQKAPNKDGVLVNLKGVANVKIQSDEASLMTAAERFLTMRPEEIKSIAFQNLEGHLRSIAGRMSIEDLVGDRTKLNQEVLNDAAMDLKKMGLGIDLLTIQEITDTMGYIDQLGKKRTAEVVRDASIGKADAEKESKVKTTTAEKDGIEAANLNQVAIAESDKLRDVKRADFKAEVDKQNAIANLAGVLQTNKTQKEVVLAEQDIEKTRAEKGTEVAIALADQKEKQLLSTVIKPAEATKQKNIIDADGEQQRTIKIAEGEKQKRTLEGEGEGAALKARAIGEAEGIKAKMIAEADGKRAMLLAEADGKRAMWLAEAEGLLKKADAYKQLDQAGKLLQILDVAERLVPNAIEKFAAVMQAAAEPMSNIKDVKIIDFGGGGVAGDKGSSLVKFGQVAPEMVFKFVSALTAAGINPADLAKRFGLDLDGFLGGNTLAATPEKEEKPE